MLFLVATDVVTAIKKLFVTVTAATVKNTVFPVFMPCIFIHMEVSDSLVGKILVASSSKISVLFYEIT